MDFSSRLFSSRLFKGFIALSILGMLLVVGIATGTFDAPVKPFDVGFESGMLEEPDWQVDNAGGCGFEVITEPVRSGDYALKIDAPTGGRCEILPWVGSTVLGRLVREPFEKDRWYAFSVLLPEGWTPDPENEVIAQWHGSKDVFFGEKGGRGPPLAVRVVGNEWRITHGFDEDLVSSPGAKASRIVARSPISPGKWVDFLFHVRWSYQGTGLTRIWMNDELVVDLKGSNAYNDFRGVYLKIGNYHPGVERTVFLDAIKVADTRPE